MKQLNMIDRPDGLKWLWQWKDQEPIKVVTGIRRCGKSTLLSIFQSQLRENGIEDNQIIAVNFEHPDFMELYKSSDVWKYLKPRIVQGRKMYVFLDEIQRIKDFEKVVDGLFVLPDVDVYITGSNACLLSGELATYLSGRYVTLHLTALPQANPRNGHIETIWRSVLFRIGMNGIEIRNLWMIIWKVFSILFLERIS